MKDRIPVEKCLSIACGFGHVERTLAGYGVAKTIVGTDIAPGAISEAKKLAKQQGFENIEYFQADLNERDLPGEEYDIVWANGALHHIEKLDVLIPKLYGALKPGGILVTNEYVGPNYQQVDERRQEFINSVKHLLPEDLRSKSIFRKPRLRGKLLAIIETIRKKLDPVLTKSVYEPLWEVRPQSYFMMTDPSEGVNSERIIPTLREFFKSVEVFPYNGSILFYALDKKFYDNFELDNPKHQAVLEMLFAIEDKLLAAGEMGSDNAHIVCRK
ncbi:MAG: class I SAM-dependent methyltransferase [Opitutales bacterium]|nr:class I SAM-dependent methyltransferase [Opitutales bacterium]